MKTLLEDQQIDTIVHFAAQTHVDVSFGNALHFTHTNVLGTHVLLESAKALGDQIQRFIHVSTEYVFIFVCLLSLRNSIELLYSEVYGESNVSLTICQRPNTSTHIPSG